MVMNHHSVRFLILLILAEVCIPAIPYTNASIFADVNQTVTYRIDKEWATIWINEDASIELLYNITITYESNALGYITVGMPASGFYIDSVTNLEGAQLTSDDISSGSNYQIEAYFGHPMSPGDQDTVIIRAAVPNMVFVDEMNEGNVGMQFTPTYFPEEVLNLRVAIVPPEGVTEDEIKTSEPAFFTTVDGALAVFWEENNLAPNTQLTFGISIPEAYVTLPSTDSDGDLWTFLALILVVIGGVVTLILILRRRRKENYEKPKISIEALGPRRGLTAVEAAVVVHTNPAKVLTMILFGLLMKGLVSVIEVDPLIRVSRIEQKAQDTSLPRKRYYEIDFLQAIEPKGSLNEKRLARSYLSLRDNVDKKMKGYSRVDTEKYYNSIVAKAWDQVTQASTPQLKGTVIDQNLQWLLMDEKYSDKFRTAFPPNMLFLPRPGWAWYWHSPLVPRSRGTAPTLPTRPSGTPEYQPIPAQEFADSVVSGIEKATNNLVRDAENFAKRLIPPPKSAQSARSVRRRSSCVCACASCACACACVSCACACAGGGAR
ncbi:MAG: DUF2207 domain-containing protein [Candidatus Bathyarchaeota archaeon]|nr:MAG: DUF2207 domain-containing protein [Candidatus Bathyarchaeota archaeon]